MENNDFDVDLIDVPDDRNVELLHQFSVTNINDDVRRDAWVIFKDGPHPLGLTRHQWLEGHNGVGPTLAEFARNSYAIHASLTNNEKLKIDGKYGEHDYMPPQIFRKNLPLTESQQKVVDSINGEKERIKKEYAFKADNFRSIARKIGIPEDIPEFERKLEGKEQIYETKGGGVQPCLFKYDNQIRAGNNIPNLQFWKGDQLLSVAWRTKNGNKDYDGMSLADAMKKAEKDHGPGVEIALRANNNRTMGIAQLNHYDEGKGAEKRWAAQIGARSQNSNFSQLSVVMTNAIGAPSANMDFRWLKTFAYAEHEDEHQKAAAKAAKALIEKLQNGELPHHLRIIASGSGRTSVPFAMEKFGDTTKKLLSEAGIPESIAERRADFANYKGIGESLPAVSVPHAPYVDGAPDPGVDVMSSYSPDQIMIAGRNGNGDRTGSQRSLAAYAERKLRLPDDAAQELGLAPDVYSKAAQRPSNLYPDRLRSNGGSREW